MPLVFVTPQKGIARYATFDPGELASFNEQDVKTHFIWYSSFPNQKQELIEVNNIVRSYSKHTYTHYFMIDHRQMDLYITPM